MPVRYAAAAFVSLTCALLFAACGGGGGNDGYKTLEAPTLATVIDVTPRSGATPAEQGQGAIYWRTQDGFASLQAGVPYKALFRIANGYEEPTLHVVAQPQDGGQPVEFELNRAQPGPGEAPGSYYPSNIDLPLPGQWVLTVTAGADTASIPVTVSPATTTPAP